MFVFSKSIVKSPIHKRGFYFGHMIACETGRSMFDFTDYVCFCGYGGEGKPVDALDTYVHLLRYRL